MSEPSNRVADLVEVARSRLAELVPDGPLWRTVTDEWLRSVGEQFVDAHPLAHLPPLLLLLARNGAETLKAFDEDVLAVNRASSQVGRVEGFLRSGIHVDHGSARQWFAGCVEVNLAAAAIRRYGPDCVEVDPLLPNGRRSDVLVVLPDGTPVWFEVTALTTSNQEFAEFDHEADVQVRAGDPYHDARRVYRKVFDKIAGPIDRLGSQLHPVEPSVVVLVDGSVISPNLDSLGADWAVDQLTDPAAREAQSAASLEAFIHHDYPGQERFAWAQLKHLSALVLVEHGNGEARTRGSRDADQDHHLTADQLREIEALVAECRPWR